MRPLQDLTADLRFATRTFRRSPTFTITAIISLALGIGANSAIFTALDAVLWKPLPVANPHSLLRLMATRGDERYLASLPSGFVDQLHRADILSEVATFSNDGLSFSYDGRAERIVGEFVSPNYFTFLGVSPMLGQAFTPQVRSGHWAPEAVLSYRFWKRRFAGDPTVIGRTIHLNTYPFVIVGVSPPSFFDLEQGFEPELRLAVLPAGQQLSQIAEIGNSPTRNWDTAGRIKPGLRLAQVEAAVDSQFQEFLRTTPVQEIRRRNYHHARVLAGDKSWPGQLEEFQAPLFVLLALVAAVLLIACANVANMLLARATARSRELSIRASLGAGRARLVRQMLAESVLLSLLGGAFGILVANAAEQLLIHFLPQGHISIVMDLHPDARALTFTFVLALATGLLFGLVPALQSTRGQLAATLKTDSAASIGESSRTGFRGALVIAQVAFSLVLLIAAGLFARTMANLRPTDYRVRPDLVLLFTMKPQQEIYSAERKRVLARELIRRVSAIPGVQSAALAENGPLGSRSDSESIAVPGGQSIQVADDEVTPGFFDSIGLPLIAGRDFTAADQPGSPWVAIINEALARALFKNENPIGRTIQDVDGSVNHRLQVVGVVGNSHYYDLRSAPPPVVYFTYQDSAPYMPTLHVRTSAPDTAGTIAAVRREFDALDKGFPVFNIKTLELRIEDSMARERMVANLAGVLGLLALLLAAVGLYGVLAYLVSRRTREIGIRMALGADAGSVVWLIAREALLLIAAGSITGIAIATLAGRLLRSYLFGISPADPITLLASASTMLVISAIAVCVPAARAARIDPLVALHYD
ncbi:MAG TPA: ABC transporter permease [Bryobacteraceae bacterium]|jgi:predicted permease|nr:ABC transporter permease [Bryobacteraceae bacterium]